MLNDCADFIERFYPNFFLDEKVNKKSRQNYASSRSVALLELLQK
jgi:hypothetical protein